MTEVPRDGYVGGGARRGLERPGGVREYQVDALGDEAVDYCAAVGLLSVRVLLTKDHVVLAEKFSQRVLKAARGLAEGHVFHLFADAHDIGIGVVGALTVVLGGAAGRKRERHRRRDRGREQFLVHFGYLFS